MSEKDEVIKNLYYDRSGYQVNSKNISRGKTER
jgi:hypothetical protein